MCLKNICRLTASLLPVGASTLACAGTFEFFNIGNLSNGPATGYARSVPVFLGNDGKVYGHSMTYSGSTENGYRMYSWTSTTGISNLGTAQLNSAGYGYAKPMFKLGNSIYGVSKVYNGGADLGLRPFVYTNGSYVTLPDIGTDSSGNGQTIPAAVDSIGRIYGNGNLYEANLNVGNHVWVCDNGAMTVIPDMGRSSSGKGNSTLLAISPTGTMYGTADSYNASHAATGKRGWVYTRTGLTNIGYLGANLGGVANTIVTGVNVAAGHVFGSSTKYSASFSQGTRAFLWTATDGMISLGTLGTTTGATDNGVGNSEAKFEFGDAIFGVAANYENGVNKGNRTFIWRPGVGMASIGILSTDSTGKGVSAPTFVDGKGRLIGTYSYYENGVLKGTRAYRWTAGGGLADLGFVGTATTTYSVNPIGSDADGNVYCLIINSNETLGKRLAIWNESSGMQYLDVALGLGSSWQLTELTSYANGMVLGDGLYNGNQSSFGFKAAGLRIVPEPSTFIATGMGALLLISRRRRVRR